GADRPGQADMKAKDVVPGVFSRHAAAYRDRLVDAAARGETRSRGRALHLLAVRPGERGLALGCGPGTPAFRLVQARRGSGLGGGRGAGGLALRGGGGGGGAGLGGGVARAPGWRARARAGAAPPPLLAQMDLERLALGDGAFDAVASGHSLHFCPDLPAALAEARRVLRQGGRFAASVPLSVPRQSRLLDDLMNELAPRSPDRSH